MHIRNAPTGLMKQLGYGAGYQYAHDSPTGFIPQEYLRNVLKGRLFYSHSVGFEKRIRERMDYWDQQRERDASILKRGRTAER